MIVESLSSYLSKSSLELFGNVTLGFLNAVLILGGSHFIYNFYAKHNLNEKEVKAK